MAIPKIKLGNFAQGEVPPPIEHQFLDFDGNAVDISTGTITFNLVRIPAGLLALGTGAKGLVTDGTDGKANYTWVTNDMNEAGFFQGQMWAAKGTNRYASDVFEYNVYDGPGTAPA